MRNLEFIKQTFKDHFNEIYERLEDERELLFPEDDENGVIPHFFFKEDANIQENWTEELIEIRFNENLINSHIIDNSEWDLEFIENYVKQIANHEYGHTITLESIFLLFPRDTRHILMEKNIREITRDDLTRCYAETRSCPPEFLTLRNINLQMLEEIFMDFWANIQVCEIIDENPPEQSLVERIKGFYGLTPEVINPKTSMDLLLYTQLFFIHDRWNQLDDIMSEAELDQLLLLYKSINTLFYKIIKLNENFDTMEEDLVGLARILESLDYQELVFDNRLNSQDRMKLRAFSSRLREKEKNLDR